MIVNVTSPTRPYADLADLTAKEILTRGWQDVDGVENYVVQFAVNLTADEEAAIRRRLTTSSAVEEELNRLGAVALATDRTFRDTTAANLTTGADAIITTPALTQANVRSLAQGVKALTTQVESLSRQNIALIRLVLRLLEAVD